MQWRGSSSTSPPISPAVEAGARVAELQVELGAQGQRLPLDPPHPEHATVGGMVASNASGLGRARYGGVRDWVIGIAVAYPSGKVARAGGKVVKNVAGYDLMKLHTGALGTLGVIAEVNFKVQAIPETAATMFGHFETPGPAVEAAVVLARRYLAPAEAIVLDRAALWECGQTADWPWTLAVKLEGYAREVTVARDQVEEAIRKAGGRTEGGDAPTSFWDRARDWSAPGDDAIVLRGTTAMNGIGALLDQAAPLGAVIAQPAAGVIDVRIPAPSAKSSLQRLRAAAGADVQVVVASARGTVKQQLDIWGVPPPGFALMRALKQSLDPNGILNPGRFVGGI